jgi:hypothetical protein
VSTAVRFIRFEGPNVNVSTAVRFIRFEGPNVSVMATLSKNWFWRRLLDGAKAVGVGSFLSFVQGEK